jgi:hypothetical protein
LPVVTQPWNISGNNLFYNTGNVGIGATPNSAYKLDIAGDARVQNNLYVGGGILISQQVEATHSLKTDTVFSASGLTKFTSDVVLKQKFQVDGNTLFNGNVQANNFNITGSAFFNSPITANQGLMFDANNGLKLNTVTSGSTTNTVFTMGKIVGAPVQLPACITANPGQTSTGGVILDVVGAIIARDAANINPTIMGFDGANHILEAGSTTGFASTNGFLVNYYCGKPTLINTGANGGKVFVGNGTSYKAFTVNGDVCLADYNTTGSGNMSAGFSGLEVLGNNQIPTRRGISLDADPNGNVNFYIHTFQNPTGFNFKNGNGNKNLFRILGNGRTIIGEETQIGIHSDALLTVNGKMVAKSCYIRIVDWADYVFAKDYKLPNLYDIEKYYLANKHLPEIPSEKEVIENGIDVAEMNKLLLKKIEEMTILMVKQQKDIDTLKEKVK